MQQRLFIQPYPLNTAVLLLIFNRLETTKQVFEAIRKAKPPRIYIAADGPRPEISDEKEKVRKVRDHVLDKIDWNCKVKTLLREKNLGCKYAVSSAISWFFENEEMGIILEDDCLPSQSFFWFCEELLIRFKEDERVSIISGRNHLGSWEKGNYSYFFTTGSIWGWASWSRAWRHCDLELERFEDPVAMKTFDLFRCKVPLKANEIINGCKKVKKNEIDTWDYQWAYSRIINNSYGVIPVRNLISNIGFSEDATHTTRLSKKEPSIYEIEFPLIHNDQMYVDYEYLNKCSDKPFASKILGVMSKLIPDLIKKKMPKYIKDYINHLFLKT